MNATLAANVLLNSQDLLARCFVSRDIDNEWGYPTANVPSLTLRVAHTLFAVARALVLQPVVHTPTLGPAPEKDAVTVRESAREARDHAAVTVFDNDRNVYVNRKLVFHRPTLDVPDSEHSENAGSTAACTCEQHPIAAALYKSREFGEAIMSPEDWEIVSEGLRRYYGMPKDVREEWIQEDRIYPRHVRGYFRFIHIAKCAEQLCPAENHYRGLELQHALDGAPEVSYPGTKLSEASPKYIEQCLAWEDGEFTRHRCPVVAFHPDDELRGYEPDDTHRWNDERVEMEESIIRAENTRRSTRGDVWLNPHRSKGNISTYVWMQRLKDRRAAERKSRQIEALCELVYGKVDVQKIGSMIQELGFDAAIAAFKDRAKGADHPAVKTTVLT